MRTRPRPGFVLYNAIKQAVNHSPMARASAKTSETRPRNADRSQKDILDAALADKQSFTGAAGAQVDAVAAAVDALVRDNPEAAKYVPGDIL